MSALGLTAAQSHRLSLDERSELQSWCVAHGIDWRNVEEIEVVDDSCVRVVEFALNNDGRRYFDRRTNDAARRSRVVAVTRPLPFARERK